MRLTKIQVEEISRLILKRLRDMEMVAINAPEDKVYRRISEIFTKDLMVEDELDREVKKILEAHEAEFKSGRMDYMKMFRKVKDQLIKERELVI